VYRWFARRRIAVPSAFGLAFAPPQAQNPELERFAW
jgi:hypothetical protein